MTDSTTPTTDPGDSVHNLSAALLHGLQGFLATHAKDIADDAAEWLVAKQRRGAKATEARLTVQKVCGLSPRRPMKAKQMRYGLSIVVKAAENGDR